MKVMNIVTYFRIKLGRVNFPYCFHFKFKIDGVSVFSSEIKGSFVLHGFFFNLIHGVFSFHLFKYSCVVG